MTSKRPNFLLIVADDLGYSDVGCFGGEIETPNLDRLAQQGLRFSDYHTAPACSPTRSMLLSGTDCHLAGLGVMHEHRRADPERWNVPGHEGFLNYDVAALPEILSDAGYWNVLSGKWHLGYREQHLPHARGFHKSWSLLPGCANHFGWEPAYQDGEGGLPRLPGHQPPIYVNDGVKAEPVPNTANSADGFYSSHSFAQNLIESLDNRTNEEKAKPFFAYLAFSAPHWPLQCLPEDRDKYAGKYDDGPAELRVRRLRRLADLGLIKDDVVPHDVMARVQGWESMTDEERKSSARAMEVYAGMVESMDRAIGLVIDNLEEKGDLDNTVVVFMSDNGAEGAALEATPVMGPKLLSAIDKCAIAIHVPNTVLTDRYYDNSYENLGNHNSFCWYGPHWAQASTAPNRLWKGFPTEGGIRVPLIVRYPGFTAYDPSNICHSFSTCMDIAPTFLKLAGIDHPNANPSHPRERASFRGRDVYPMRGKSWVNHLTSVRKSLVPWDDAYEIHTDEDPSVGWEMSGQASLRKGCWKIVNMPAKALSGTGGWQLYNLGDDQGETQDLANQFPDKLREMIVNWQTYQEETGTVFGPPVKGGANALLPDQVGGDPTDDQRVWMYLGVGKRFIDHQEGCARLKLM